MTVDGAEYYLDSSGKSHIITDQMKKDSGNMLLSADATGILIVGVTKGLGAYGKLEKGDIVTSVNGVTVATVADFAEVCLNLGVGQKISVTFIRDGEACSDTITLMTKLDMINAS